MKYTTIATFNGQATQASYELSHDEWIELDSLEEIFTELYVIEFGQANLRHDLNNSSITVFFTEDMR